MSVHVIRPIPLVLGASRLSDHTYRIDMGRNVVTCTYIWYIEGPEKKILVDTGADAECFRKHGYAGRIDVQTPEEGLAKIGVKPGDIDVVLLTHLHFDHCYLPFTAKYDKAVFIVQKSELEYMRHPLPFETRKPMADNAFDHVRLELVDGDAEIAAGVQVLLTPGHTGGGQSVAVSTAQGTAIISGLCSIPENFNPPEACKDLVPVIPTMIHVDLRQSFESLLRIKQTADVVIPLHDVRPSYVDRLP